MQITNTTGGDIGLEPGTVIPAGQTVDVPDDVARRCEASEAVRGWFKSGALVTEKPKKAAKADEKPATKPAAKKAD